MIWVKMTAMEDLTLVNWSPTCMSPGPGTMKIIDKEPLRHVGFVVSVSNLLQLDKLCKTFYKYKF